MKYDQAFIDKLIEYEKDCQIAADVIQNKWYADGNPTCYAEICDDCVAMTFVQYHECDNHITVPHIDINNIEAYILRTEKEEIIQKELRKKRKAKEARDLKKSLDAQQEQYDIREYKRLKDKFQK